MNQAVTLKSQMIETKLKYLLQALANHPIKNQITVHSFWLVDSSVAEYLLSTACATGRVTMAIANPKQKVSSPWQRKLFD